MSTPEERLKEISSLEALRREMLLLLDERDRRYDTRFADHEKLDINRHMSDDVRWTERFVAMDRALLVASDAAIKAQGLADSNYKSWKADSNEWRQTMNDRERTFVHQIAYDVSHSTVERDIRDLKERIDLQRGRGAGLNAGWVYLVGAVVTAISVLAYIRTITMH